MTDIYDFRDPIFTTYEGQWRIINKAIRQFIVVKQKCVCNDRWYKLFKKNIPGLWDKCPDDVIKSFIMRASQVNYHELVVLPNKVNNVS